MAEPVEVPMDSAELLPVEERPEEAEAKVWAELHPAAQALAHWEQEVQVKEVLSYQVDLVEVELEPTSAVPEVVVAVVVVTMVVAEDPVGPVAMLRAAEADRDM